MVLDSRVLTLGFLPCNDGLVKATKLDKGKSHPGKRCVYVAGLPGSFAWHVQSSGSLPLAAPQSYRPSLCSATCDMNLG